MKIFIGSMRRSVGVRRLLYVRVVKGLACFSETFLG